MSPKQKANLLRAALTEIVERIEAHPAWDRLTEEEELEIGGDTAELSYLARIGREALNNSEKKS